ncbi:MAG: DUF4091 domain-containing protein [Planctomycetes bacterium]|nr:DUF4091 domain-containing protein [Planctomycetota bacterium]
MTVVPAVCVASEPEAEHSPINLALGKRYSLSPPPSYAPCTDDGDSAQLTDGIAAGCNWLQQSTVGWRSPKSPPTVVIDLGAVVPIDDVHIHSIGGGRAGVHYPSQILLMVSDDGTTFHLAGGTDAFDLPHDRREGAKAPRIPHVFSLTNLKTRGRFVSLTFEPDGAYLFLDEIEVHQGTRDPAGVMFEANNRFGRDRANSLLSVVRTRSRAISALRNLSDHMEGADNPEMVAAAGVLGERARSNVILRIDAWDELERSVGALRGRWLGLQAGGRLRWRVVDPMIQPRPGDAWMFTEPASESLEIRCWQGEYESAAVSLVNASAATVRVRVAASPLRGPDGKSHDTRSMLTLRRAVFVEGRRVGLIGDALVRIPDRGFDLAPGQVGQVWITFHDPSLQSGTYEFALAISATDRATTSHDRPQVVRGTIHIDPITLLPGDTRPALRSCAWAYVRKAEATRQAAAEAVADLQRHYTGVFVVDPANIPFPKRAADGTLAIDFAKHDSMVELYRGADQLLFFWGRSGSKPALPQLGRTMTPAWQRAVAEWLKRWVAHLADLGIGYDQFAMYPYDETLSEEFYLLARFIKESVDPQIRIYANSRGKKGTHEMARIEPYIDIWCLPDRPYQYHDPSDRRPVRPGATIWTYSTRGPGKANPPYSYYRLQAWRAFERGDTGCGFWVYADPRPGAGSLWNDFNTQVGRYGVVYGASGSPVPTGTEGIVPSRRWEAWRDGIEDYEYLHRLQSLIDRSKSTGVRKAIVEQAVVILRDAVQAVLSRPDDSDTVQQARQQISEAVLALENAANAG